MPPSERGRGEAWDWRAAISAAASCLMAMIWEASLAVASAVFKMEAPATCLLPGVLSAAVSALYVPGHITTGMLEPGVPGAAAGEGFAGGWVLPAAAFLFERSFGK